MGRARVATFNAENLFSRAEIFNFENHEAAKPYLLKLAELNSLLAKDQYDAKDKADIVKLVDELRRFIDVNELRERLLSSNLKNVIVDGRHAWAGGIRLTRSRVLLEAQKNTAKVIEAVDADLMAIVEVEDRITLEQFSRHLFAPPRRYPYNMAIDGNDDRGIDCGLLSRFPLREMRTHIFDLDARGSRIFSRDCLEIAVELPNGKRLWLLINHFKSMGGGSQQANDARRKVQVDRVVELLQAFDLATDLVIVLGDFNAHPDSATLQPLLRHPRLTDVVNKLPAGEQWTYYDRKRLDYILVSDSLLDNVTVGIERRGMADVAKLTDGAIQPFPTVTSEANAASDHAAVWVDMTI